MFVSFLFFFFNDTATTEIYTLSLHDALPILAYSPAGLSWASNANQLASTSGMLTRASGNHTQWALKASAWRDRKSTRLNSSHANISYAVFCLKKKKKSNNYSIL